MKKRSKGINSLEPSKPSGGAQKLGHAELRVLKWKKQQYSRNKSRLLSNQSRKKKAEENAREDGMKAADRKSVEGMLKLARKETRRLKDDPGKLKKAQKRIRKLLSYLEYTNCFPEGERYIPLFDDAEDPSATKMAKESRRKEILASVKKDLAGVWASDQTTICNAQPDEELKSATEGIVKCNAEGRDDFFLYSDEDDQTVMVPADPLTAADLQKKVRKRYSKGETGSKGDRKYNKRHRQQYKHYQG